MNNGMTFLFLSPFLLSISLQRTLNGRHPQWGSPVNGEPHYNSLHTLKRGETLGKLQKEVRLILRETQRAGRTDGADQGNMIGLIVGG